MAANCRVRVGKVGGKAMRVGRQGLMIRFDREIPTDADPMELKVTDISAQRVQLFYQVPDEDGPLVCGQEECPHCRGGGR